MTVGDRRYVALSHARHTTHIYATADTPEQAASDLSSEWSTSTRQRWAIDTDTPATPDSSVRPHLARRAGDAVRTARLRPERAALAAVAPHEHRRLARLDAQIEFDTPSLSKRAENVGLGLSV